MKDATPPPVLPPEPAHALHRERLWNALPWILGVLALIAVARFNPAEHSFFPRCAFNEWTGWDCPGCGGTRAVHQLFRGHPLEALRLNPFVTLLLPLAALSLPWTAWKRHRGHPIPWLPTSPRFWLSLLAALVVFAVLRNLPFAPFSHLRA